MDLARNPRSISVKPKTHSVTARNGGIRIPPLRSCHCPNALAPRPEGVARGWPEVAKGWPPVIFGDDMARPLPDPLPETPDPSIPWGDRGRRKGPAIRLILASSSQKKPDPSPAPMPRASASAQHGLPLCCRLSRAARPAPALRRTRSRACAPRFIRRHATCPGVLLSHAEMRQTGARLAQAGSTPEAPSPFRRPLRR